MMPSDFVPSDEILEEVLTQMCRSSSDMEVCLCGRTTFNNQWQSEEELVPDLDELRKKAESDPDKYSEVHYSVSTLYTYYGENKGHIVLGCPCGIAMKIAKQWLASRRQIRDFFIYYTSKVALFNDEQRRHASEVVSTVRKLEN